MLLAVILSALAVRTAAPIDPIFWAHALEHKLIGLNATRSEVLQLQRFWFARQA